MKIDDFSNQNVLTFLLTNERSGVLWFFSGNF